MRFRRVSFPLSALLSIVSSCLYFHPGLNLGIDFRGGTLIEVQSKTGPADLAKMRATLASLNLGDVQLQQFGADTDGLTRFPHPPSPASLRAALHWSRSAATPTCSSASPNSRAAPRRSAPRSPRCATRSATTSN